MYAVVETGGKQYKVVPGETIDVEKLSAEAGETVELDKVLLVADGGKVTVGRPTIAGAKVVARVLEHDRGPKIVVFKYKPKKRYRRRMGHRQSLTRLSVSQIVY